MSSKVIIKIIVPRNHEIPSGVYHSKEYEISDSQWENMRSAVSQLETELSHYSPTIQRVGSKMEETK